MRYKNSKKKYQSFRKTENYEKKNYERYHLTLCAFKQK